MRKKDDHYDEDREEDRDEEEFEDDMSRIFVRRRGYRERIIDDTSLSDLLDGFVTISV